MIVSDNDSISLRMFTAFRGEVGSWYILTRLDNHRSLHSYYQILLPDASHSRLLTRRYHYVLTEVPTATRLCTSVGHVRQGPRVPVTSSSRFGHFQSTLKDLGCISVPRREQRWSVSAKNAPQPRVFSTQGNVGFGGLDFVSSLRLFSICSAQPLRVIGHMVLPPRDMAQSPFSCTSDQRHCLPRFPVAF